MGELDDLTTTENCPPWGSSVSLLGSWKTEVPGMTAGIVRVFTSLPSLNAKKSMVTSVATEPTFWTMNGVCQPSAPPSIRVMFGR